jgi:hypothetical protein
MPKRTLILLALAMQFARPAAAEDGSWTIGDYRVALHTTGEKSGRPKSTLTVSRAGKPVHRMSSAVLTVNPTGFFVDLGPDADYEETQKPYEVGSDVLGLGAPSLAVEGFTGGAHCCYDVTVLVLGPEFRALPTIHLLDSELARFKRVSGRDALVLSLNDFTFAYWWASFAASSAPTVLMSYDAKTGRYAADAELMRAPLPAPETLAKQQADARAAHEKELRDDKRSVPSELTEPVLDLIYSGHLAEAREFLAKAWAGPAPLREEYWSDLTTCQLRLSPFWPIVAKLNGLPPEKPVGRCRRPRG